MKGTEETDQYIDVLCITTKLCIGGVQSFLMNNVELLLRHGIRLNFCVSTDEKQIYDDYVTSLGCKIYRVTSILESKRGFISDLRSLIKAHPELKIVHSHLNFANIYSFLSAAGLGRVCISHAHSTYAPSGLINRMTKSVIKAATPLLCDAYWACSEQALKWIYGPHARSQKAAVIRNAIDTDRFAYNPAKRAEIRAKLGIVANEFVWIHTGSFSPVKNHAFLIDLFARYQQRNPNSKLLLCGDGSLRTEIETQIAELGLRGKVMLLGNVRNCEDYLSAADTFVFPSKYEGFALSLLEAQCAGTTTTTTTTAVPPEVRLRHCTVIDGYDFDEWIDAIETSRNITNDRSEGKHFIEEAGFSSEKEAERLAKLYKKLIYKIQRGQEQ